METENTGVGLQRCRIRQVLVYVRYVCDHHMETVSDKTRARTDRAYITWKRITQVLDKTSFTVRTHGMFAGITYAYEVTQGN